MRTVTPEHRQWRNYRRGRDKRTLALVDGLLELRRDEDERTRRITAEWIREMLEFVKKRTQIDTSRHEPTTKGGDK